MSRDYLTVEDVLEIHADQVERYGGAHGLRDRAGLEAAVARHRSGYYDGLVPEAAALWESLSQNHPFIDGNKRTSFSSANRFLRLNGREITAGHQQAWVFISGAFERREVNFKTLEAWLRANTRERS